MPYLWARLGTRLAAAAVPGGTKEAGGIAGAVWACVLVGRLCGRTVHLPQWVSV